MIFDGLSFGSRAVQALALTSAFVLFDGFLWDATSWTTFFLIPVLYFVTMTLIDASQSEVAQ